ncbi:hypothetical protein AQJ66_24530 [Streptomyces bungoensis]|uniref:Uncharacterized protein n=1 Tax=Streptomyces bungoensis TaxID=285568 RepID=A0A117RB82_9ACTN|nr:putative glycolipid-binding domain-containing protein [Streptomyces bungoensis]KUN81133.1 hypothetical protein AQJ66_24530 [Streptomyces bungoensis]
MTTSVLTWEITASGGYETAWIDIGDRSMRARGRAVGTVRAPYWITYTLETGDGFVTRRLHVRCDTTGGVRELDLRRNDDGHWTGNGEDRPDLDGALDCDLGLSPLTNTMPVLRHDLLADGTREFLMAWVSVPDLTVRPSRQAYTHLACTSRGARVRYSSGTFSSDILFDPDGFVLDYPDLAARLFSQ